MIPSARTVPAGTLENAQSQSVVAQTGATSHATCLLPNLSHLSGVESDSLMTSQSTA